MNVWTSLGQGLGGLLTAERLQQYFLAALIVVAGFVLLRLLTAFVGRMARRSFAPQTAMLLRKAVFYVGAALLLIVVLRQLGFHLTALLGAAGIVGIAIGFASQTSVSNIISGVFPISEKPFSVGDLIKAGDHTGIVVSIDLLSVKIRTFDNQYIRIPNERILSNDLTNVTYYPIRRMDIPLSISYRNDLNKARQILLEVADANPYCLREPEPLVIFTDFGQSGQELLLGLWFAKTDYVPLRNSILPQIKQRLEDAGIEIPFPHVTLAPGLASRPTRGRPATPSRPPTRSAAASRTRRSPRVNRRTEREV